MHRFSTLAHWCTVFTLQGLGKANEQIIDELQMSGATRLVRALQGISLQKAIFATGMFSLFEAELQDVLNDEYAFKAAKALLKEGGDIVLCEEFGNYADAINVLKHGRGRSYDRLVRRHYALPFRVKLPDESFFDEGDVSEVSTLIYVDDAFVTACADVIDRVAATLRSYYPETFV